MVAIDQAIEAEQRNAAIYKDRITALQEECRKVEYQSREAKRRRAIEKIKNRRCRGPNKAAADTAVECIS